MTPQPLRKTSPLHGLHRELGATCGDIAGWWMAEHFGNPAADAEALRSGALLVDWSHVGKLSLRGRHAAAEAAKLHRDAPGLPPLRTALAPGLAVLRLTSDEFRVLTLPGQETAALAALDEANIAAVNQTGALSCLVLAGPRRDEVLERSTAMDLRRDRAGPGTVLQTSIHSITCILWRTARREVLLVERDYAQSLFEALLDVGQGVGLRPAGLATLPVSLQEGD